MYTSIIASKLYIPPRRPKTVPRPRLMKKLNEGLYRKLTLVSASAGFGKTTLISEWLADCGHPAAWLSMDEGDNDLSRFLTYLTAALQSIEAKIGEGVFDVLQSPQPPSTDSILTVLINDVANSVSDRFILALDDYHLIDTEPINKALSFLVEHLPPNMHLVISTREDPPFPLAKMRARDQLTELRGTDLRFTHSETVAFLHRVMDLNLSAETISALETRTEGWIAGLQLAAISMQGHQDATGFIKSFTGNHHYVLDYLVEEVLQQQTEDVQTFLLYTSILERLCGSLCDAVLNHSPSSEPYPSGQEILEQLEMANLFIIPLDNERSWYRYHHLFAEALRQRLTQRSTTATDSTSTDTAVASSAGNRGRTVAELHRRASLWYQDKGQDIEAFRHAVAAGELDLATALVEGGGLPLHFRGATTTVLNWLSSLPNTVLNARPSLWVIYSSALLMTGQVDEAEQKVQAAEKVLERAELNVKNKDLIGHTASIRATLAVSRYQVEAIIDQSRKALEYLHPDNLPVRTATVWTLGHAYHLQGNRAAAKKAFTEAASTSKNIGHIIINITATIGLGEIQETENELHLATRTYQNVLQLAGEPPLPISCEAHLGLARIQYEWNNIDAALKHAEQALQLARQIEKTDRFLACEVFLTRLKLVQGDVTGASVMLKITEQIAQQYHFDHQIPEIAATQVLVLLQQDKVTEAAKLAARYKLPFSQARVHIARGEITAALSILASLRQQAEQKNWKNEQLKVMILQAVTLYEHGERDVAVQLLGNALSLAEPGGFIRIFVDEGNPMVKLLSEAAAQKTTTSYANKLLTFFKLEKKQDDKRSERSIVSHDQMLVEALSEREMEVLQLIALGLSNGEICEQLHLALSTVKGHNRNIFGKLQVRRRTEAVARARELGLLPS